uniref:Uncharacterized protein n=1 Tax=Kalanchoe fedtschenkoi TaxID=63787 RepID=A0A7N0RI35_KALFE
MWPPSSAARVLNYSIPHDMGMVGLRDLFVVAPASSFHHSSLNEPNLMAEGLGGGNPATALGVGLGVIPLLTAAPCIADDGGVNGRSSRGGGGIQLWQNPGLNGGNNNNASVMQTMGASSSSSTCQDCGNQAKKDCSHRRCRTCCKSRGYDCSTHVKSTWVPASRRRERQLLASSTGASSASMSLSAGSGVKKARLVSSNAATSHTSNSNTPPRSFETTSCHQDPTFKETLPGQILAPATFKCVKVTSINDGDDEFAYQAMVKIGGHVFKGFLYDQGEESGTREHQQPGMPNISDLHLGGGNGGGGMHKVSCSTTGLEAPLADVYGGGSTSGGGILGGSGYGNPIIN